MLLIPQIWTIRFPSKRRQRANERNSAICKFTVHIWAHTKGTTSKSHLTQQNRSTRLAALVISTVMVRIQCRNKSFPAHSVLLLYKCRFRLLTPQVFFTVQEFVKRHDENVIQKSPWHIFQTFNSPSQIIVMTTIVFFFLTMTCFDQEFWDTIFSTGTWRDCWDSTSNLGWPSVTAGHVEAFYISSPVPCFGN